MPVFSRFSRIEPIFQIFGFWVSVVFCPKITATKIAKRGKGGFLREIDEEGEKKCV